MKGVSCGWRFPHPSSHPLRLQYHRALVRFPFNRNPHRRPKWAQGEGYSVSLYFGEIKKKKADHPKICVRHHQVDDAHFFRGFCCCGRCFFSVENRTQVASQDHRVMALFSLILCCQRRKTLDWTSSALLIEKKPLSVGVKYCAR